METLRQRLATPGLAAVVVVGLALGSLLVGYQPVGGDPDWMYRPIKGELAHALREGRLPYWSDRFGLGIPLVAESHVAAFYPPNLLLYRLLDVELAYRLAMWANYAALAAATYAYARTLGLSDWGSALAAVAFSLCGFLSVHSGHEPFYYLMPYLPLALLLAERYMASGRLVLLPLLALTYGAQLTLGHFQLQMWTGGLVLLTGLWRAAVDGRPWRRALGVGLGLGWGAAIALVQLALTWELSREAYFDRPAPYLALYGFPPAHLAQLALPRLFLGQKNNVVEHAYWDIMRTTAGESALYVGTVPLILAFVGLAAGRHRGLAPWKLLIPISLLMATLPYTWIEAQHALKQVPGLGYFRCPGRYTLLASLGLCLLAGRGLDRTLSRGRFAAGLVAAVLLGVAAAIWGYYWVTHSALGPIIGEAGLAWRMIPAGVSWVVALATVGLWWRGRVGPWAPLVVTAVELTILFYFGSNAWGRTTPLPEASPVLSRLAREPGVQLVAGRLEDLPVRAGLTPAVPYLGIIPPHPNYLLDPAKQPDFVFDSSKSSWLKRFGVTHGIWRQQVPSLGADVLYAGPDTTLDRLATRAPDDPAHATWKVVRYHDVLPPARVAFRVRTEAKWPGLYSSLSRSVVPEDVWYLDEDCPPDDGSTRARSARVVSWDGRNAVVEHDGTCDLVLSKTHYPGWMVRVDGGPARPALKADGGLLAVRLVGSGTSRVEVDFRPRGLSWAPVSLTALAVALLALAVAAVHRLRMPKASLPESSEVTVDRGRPLLVGRLPGGQAG